MLQIRNNTIVERNLICIARNAKRHLMKPSLSVIHSSGSAERGKGCEGLQTSGPLAAASDRRRLRDLASLGPCSRESRLLLASLSEKHPFSLASDIPSIPKGALGRERVRELPKVALAS